MPGDVRGIDGHHVTQVAEEGSFASAGQTYKFQGMEEF